MLLTDSDLQVIRRCCKDDLAYQELVALFAGLPSKQKLAARVPMESLRESENKYYQLFELESDAVFLIDNETGSLLEANAAATTLYGYSRDELMGMKNTDLSAQPDLTRQATQDRETFIPLRYHRKKDGTTFPAEITGRHFVWHGRMQHIAAVRDITSRQQAEAELRESEERYRRLVELLPDGVIIHFRGKIIFANTAALKLMGAASLPDIHHMSAIDFVHPDYREIALRRIQQMLKTGIIAPSTEEKFVRLDGTPMDVEVAAVPFPHHDEMAALVVFRDIAERKQAARQALELAVERERVQILTGFIQAASHEFRTPLSVINTSAYLLTSGSNDLREQRHQQLIFQQVRRLAALLDDMLMMAQLDSAVRFDFKSVDINLILNSVVGGQYALIAQKDHQLQLELASQLPLIPGDPHKLTRVFANLLSNAVRYTPAGGRIRLRTGIRDQHVVVEVSDNGVGMSQDTLKRIFERFYRADQAHTLSGFGLGLPIARKIIEGHQGRIEAESEPGSGSTFRVLLPIAPT